VPPRAQSDLFTKLQGNFIIKKELKNVETAADLAPHYSELYALLLENRFEVVNSFLQEIDIENSSILVLMGFSRLTSSWRKHIKSWKSYTRAVYDEINRRGENADKIMRGVSAYVMSDEELIIEAGLSKNNYYVIHRIMHKFNLSHADAVDNLDAFIESGGMI